MFEEKYVIQRLLDTKLKVQMIFRLIGYRKEVNDIISIKNKNTKVVICKIQRVVGLITSGKYRENICFKASYRLMVLQLTIDN